MRTSRRSSLPLLGVVAMFLSRGSFGQQIPQPKTFKGTLRVMVEDHPQGEKIRYYLDTATQRLELKFGKNPPKGLWTGSPVFATGTVSGNTLALTSGSNLQTATTSTSPAVLSNTFGAQSTLVMLVNFQDNATQPYSISSASSVVFGSTGSVTGFYSENSYQQTWFTGDVVGWYTLPISSTACDNNVIATYANQAATAAGINLSNYAHYVYAFPSVSCFGWWGLSTIGGSPSQTWINGSFALKVVGHELGHSLGLYHSHAMYCSTGTSLCSNPTLVEYGDAIDIMGNPSSSHFNAFQKERLGWLNYGTSPPINLVQANGTYTIGPMENQDSATKALKILQSTNPTTGVSTYYYVEYRQAVGYDQPLYNDAQLLNGVLVHVATSDPNSDELINLAPSLNNFSESALDVGQTFIDPSAGLTLTTVSADSASATVSVAFGTPSCTHYNPTVLASPSQSLNVPPGTAVTYSVSITNNDNAGCSSTTFNLGGTMPAGWNAAYANPSLTIPYGQVASTTFTVVSPTTVATGQYGVTISATNATAANYSGSTSVIYNVNTVPCARANPTVTLNPTLTSSLQPGTAYTFTLYVTNNDNTSCNSSTFSLSDSIPSGWSGALGIPSLTIAPGGRAGTSLIVTSPVTARGGSYSFSGTATNTAAPGYSTTVAATYVVAGGASCTRANPTVSVTPSQSQAVTPGTPVAFAVSVKNNDSSACSTSNFSLSDTIPGGWSGTWNSSAISLSPGTSGSSTLTVTSATNLTTGSYPVSVSAQNSSAISYAGAATASYVASANTTAGISIATNQSNYVPGQSVAIAVTLASSTGPIAGALVSVSISNANGNLTTVSGTTGSNGVASLTYKLKKQALAGTYQARASTTSTGNAASASASTTFTVQ